MERTPTACLLPGSHTRRTSWAPYPVDLGITRPSFRHHTPNCSASSAPKLGGSAPTRPGHAGSPVGLPCWCFNPDEPPRHLAPRPSGLQRLAAGRVCPRPPAWHPQALGTLDPLDPRGGARPRSLAHLHVGFFNFKRDLRGGGEACRRETHIPMITSPSPTRDDGRHPRCQTPFLDAPHRHRSRWTWAWYAR